MKSVAFTFGSESSRAVDSESDSGVTVLFSPPSANQFTFNVSIPPHAVPTSLYHANFNSALPRLCRPSLTTIPFDVQEDIFSYLSISSLSALSKTCRLIRRMTLHTLCARSGDIPMDTLERLRSFCKFLHAGRPSTRAPFIQALTFKEVRYGDPTFNELEHQELVSHILRECHDIRSLNIDHWSVSDLLSGEDELVSRLRNLQEVRLPSKAYERLNDIMTPNIRKIFVSNVWYPTHWRFRRSLDTLAPATSSLVDAHIEIVVEIPPNLVFPRVRRLGTCLSHDPGYPTKLARAFPNITHLALYSQEDFEEGLQRASLLQGNLSAWNEYEHELHGLLTHYGTQEIRPWTELHSVYTHGMHLLSALAFPYHIPSVKLKTDSEEDFASVSSFVAALVLLDATLLECHTISYDQTRKVQAYSAICSAIAETTTERGSVFQSLRRISFNLQWTKYDVSGPYIRRRSTMTMHTPMRSPKNYVKAITVSFVCSACTHEYTLTLS